MHEVARRRPARSRRRRRSRRRARRRTRPSSARGVVVGRAEHVRAAAVAGEQRARRAGARGQLAQLRVERVRAGPRAADCASRTWSRTVCPTRTCSPTVIVPVVLVDAEEPADQEVAALVVGLVRVDHDPEQQPVGEPAPLGGVELARSPRAAARAPAGWRARGSTLPSAAVIDHLRPDRARALRDAGAHVDAAQRHARPRPSATSAAVVRAAPRAPGAARAGEAADDRQARVRRPRAARAAARPGTSRGRPAASPRRRRRGRAARRPPRRRRPAGVTLEVKRRRPRAAGSDAAHTATPPCSNSRPSPSTPWAPQPRARRRRAARDRGQPVLGVLEWSAAGEHDARSAPPPEPRPGAAPRPRRTPRRRRDPRRSRWRSASPRPYSRAPGRGALDNRSNHD